MHTKKGPLQMVDQSTQNIQRAMREKSTSELHDISNESDATVWTPQAIEIAIDELLKRGEIIREQNPPINMTSSETSPDKLVAGIGGWLILPAIGIVLSPIILVGLVILDWPTFDLVASGTDIHNFLIFEALGTMAFAGFASYVAIKFFQKKSTAPNLFIAYILGSLIFFILYDLIAASFFSVPFFDTGTAWRLFRDIISAGIWVSYFNMSRRVRNTFTQ
jgi:hypothetical protein